MQLILQETGIVSEPAMRATMSSVYISWLVILKADESQLVQSKRKQTWSLTMSEPCINVKQRLLNLPRLLQCNQRVQI